MIDDPGKHVTTIHKSKMDWKKYTKDAKIDADLENHRKDGFLQKKVFVEKAVDNEYLNKKEVEKHYRSSRK